MTAPKAAPAASTNPAVANGVRERVAAALAESGLSQRGFAAKVGLDHAQLSRLLAGKTGLTLDSLRTLAAALDTTVGALIGEAADTPAGGPYLRLPLHALEPDLGQPRQEFDETIEHLAASIEAHGLLQPIVVTDWTGPVDSCLQPPPTHLILAGERRFRALCLLEKRLASEGRSISELPGFADGLVPCVLRATEEDSGKTLAAQLVENLQREELRPGDLARAYRRLKDDAGWSTGEIAAAIGRTARHVQSYLALVERLGPLTLDALDTGRLSYAQARGLTQATQDVQNQLLPRILAGELRTEAEIHAAVTAAGRKQETATDQIDLEELTATPDSATEPSAAPRAAVVLYTLDQWPPADEPPVVTPNKHGVYPYQEELVVWNDNKSHGYFLLRFAHCPDGWRFTKRAALVNHGGSSPIHVRDTAYPDRDAAFRVARSVCLDWIQQRAAECGAASHAQRRQLKSLWNTLADWHGPEPLQFPNVAVPAPAEQQPPAPDNPPPAPAAESPIDLEALRARLANDPYQALRLLTACLCRPRLAVLVEPHIACEASSHLARTMAGDLAMSDRLPPIWSRRLGTNDPGGLIDIWLRLGQHPQADLLGLLAELVAARLGPTDPFDGYKGRSLLGRLDEALADPRPRFLVDKTSQKETA